MKKITDVSTMAHYAFNKIGGLAGEEFDEEEVGRMDAFRF